LGLRAASVVRVDLMGPVDLAALADLAALVDRVALAVPADSVDQEAEALAAEWEAAAGARATGTGRSYDEALFEDALCPAYLASDLRLGIRSRHDVHVHILPADLNGPSRSGASAPIRSARLR
jgi:hypothetical protein